MTIVFLTGRGAGPAALGLTGVGGTCGRSSGRSAGDSLPSAAAAHSRQVIAYVVLSQRAFVEAGRTAPHTEQVPAYRIRMTSVVMFPLPSGADANNS